MATKIKSDYPQVRIYYKTQNGTYKPNKNNKVIMMAIIWKDNIYANVGSPFPKMYEELTKAFGSQGEGMRTKTNMICQEIVASEENLYYFKSRNYAEVSYIRSKYFIRSSLDENCLPCWDTLKRIEKELEQAYLNHQLYNHYRFCPEELEKEEK